MIPFENVPYTGIVSLIILIILSLSLSWKKLDKLNFLGFTNEDKLIIILLFILIIVFDFLSNLPKTCTDYIPKLPNILLVVVLLFIFVVGIVRKKEQKDKKEGAKSG